MAPHSQLDLDSQELPPIVAVLNSTNIFRHFLQPTIAAPKTSIFARADRAQESCVECTLNFRCSKIEILVKNRKFRFLTKILFFTKILIFDQNFNF